MFQPQQSPFPSYASFGMPSMSMSNAHVMSELNFGYQLPAASRMDAVQQRGQTLDLRSGQRSHAVPTPTASTPNPYNYNQHRTSKTRATMNESIVATDIAAQQNAAHSYEPDLSGPLVGVIKSSHAITAEYAKADPVYVAKTAALPQTYSHYRPVLGDGNCGWRAIAFCYFEVLQRMNDISRLEDELGRMLSMGSFIQNATSYDSMIYEDMQQAVLDLLQELIDTAATPQEDTDSVVLRTLNDDELSNSIVYFMRLLASSWMQTYSHDYAPFIDGMTIEEYRKGTIEPVNCEIEHVGIKVLVDVLLKPIGISVEVVYLDRSPGSQVNTVPMQATDSDGNLILTGGPSAYLLYRPGHYDILYKQQIVAPATIQDHIASGNDIEIRRVSSVGHQDAQWVSAPSFGSGFDVGLLASIPGMSFLGGPSNLGNYDTTPSFRSPSVYDLPCHPIPTNTSHRSSLSLSSHGSSPYLDTQCAAPLTTSTHHSVHSNILPKPISVPTLAGMSSSSDSFPSNTSASSSSIQQSPIHKFRGSRYEVEREFEQPPPPPLQTMTFKNSHYNVAHFNNPDFQPEEWQPEDEISMSAHHSKNRARCF